MVAGRGLGVARLAVLQAYNCNETYLGWVEFRVVRIFRVPWLNTRTTRINFGYHGLEPGLEFEFFGFGFFGYGLGFFWFDFRVSGFLPGHSCTIRSSLCYGKIFLGCLGDVATVAFF